MANKVNVRKEARKALISAFAASKPVLTAKLITKAAPIWAPVAAPIAAARAGWRLGANTAVKHVAPWIISQIKDQDITSSREEVQNIMGGKGE